MRTKLRESCVALVLRPPRPMRVAYRGDDVTRFRVPGAVVQGQSRSSRVQTASSWTFTGNFTAGA